MALPNGTKRVIPITVSKSVVSEAVSNFVYQKKLDLTNETAFKSAISSAANVTVYDPATGFIRPSYINLSSDKNTALIYFDGPTSISNDKQFYVCAGPTINRVNSAQAFTNSGISNFWGMDEDAGSTTVADYAGGSNGSVVSPATLGDKTLDISPYGNCEINSQIFPIGSLVVDFMIYTRGFKNYSIILSNKTTTRFQLVSTSTGNLIIKVDGVNGLEFNTAMQINTWYHVVLSRNSANLITCYLNGSSINSLSSNPILGSDDALIGSNTVYYLNSKIDSLLTSTTIKSPNIISTRSAMLMQPDQFWTQGVSFGVGGNNSLWNKVKARIRAGF